jgi:hypothetical protein
VPVRRVIAALAAIAAVAVAAAGLTTADGRAPASRMPGALPGSRRVLAQDFHGTGLDRRVWTRYSGRPGGDPGGWWAPSHVSVRGGLLHLETFRDPRYGNRWVSGGVSSAHGLEQRYGQYLVRFRMDAGGLPACSCCGRRRRTGHRRSTSPRTAARGRGAGR